LNAFGLEASEAEQVASAFFTAQKFGKTTVEELSNSIGQVAPIAKQAGLGYQELLSAMAVLTKQGLNTNISTSTLRATISALMKPAEGARKEFDRLGISYGASGLQADGLMKIMGQISKAAEEDVDALAKLIPNVQALTGVGALGTAQLADYDAILQQVNMDYGESSSLSEAVVMQQETLEQAQARLNAEWTAQKVLLGEELKPIFANVINTMSTLISHAQTIGRVLKSGAVAWGTYQVGVVAANVIQKVMNGTITQATIKQKALNLAVKANPYVLFASLLAGAVAMLWDSAEATEAAATEQDRYTKTLENLDNIQIRADEHLDTEIAKLNILNDTILSETSSRQQKQAAIDTMNDKYGTTLQFMSDEAGMAKQLEGAYNGAMAALKAKIVLQASQEQLLEVTKEQMALEEELFTLTGLRGDVQTVLNDAEKEYTRLQGVKTQMQDDWMEQNKRDSDEIWWQYEERMRRSLAEEAQYENVNKQLMNYSIGTHAATNKITVMSEKQRVLQEKIASATAELNKYLQTNKKDTKVEMDKTSVYAMSEDTLNQIALKKKELTRLMRDENRGSEEYIKLEKEIARLTALTTQAKVVKTQTIQDAIAKQTEEVAGLKKNMDMLKGKKGVEEEAGQVKVKWAQESIRLILLEAEANANLSEDQLARIAKLKEAIADVQNSSLSDDGGRASLLTNMFGEDGGAAVYDTTMQSLQAIGGLISANNALAEAESNQKLKVLEKERKDEKKMLKESAKWETMNDEEKRKALEDIDKKYDDKKAIIEEEAFNRNKKVQRQQAIISGAMAIMRIAADVPKLDFGIMTGLLIAAQIAMTAMQLQAIDATKYVKSAKGMIIPKFEKGGIAQGGSFKRGGMFSGPSHATGGIKFSQGGHIMEAEGGEAIINKASTAMYRNELSAINQAGGGIAFADGGIVNAQKLAAEAMTRDMLSATDIARISESLTSQEVVMVESEVTGTQRTVGIQESRASF
jgi:TP901 family phage tail tape measure protein